jgi:uncharacterized protein
MTLSARLPLAALALAAAVAGAAPAMAQSFSCATKTAPDERAICADCGLAQLDVKLAVMYEVLTKTSGMGVRADLREAQRVWLGTRAACGGNVACLTGAYRARIGVLQADLDTLYSRGPF